MESIPNEPEIEEDKFSCSLENSPKATCSEFEKYDVINENNPLPQLTSSLSQLQTHYRKLKRMHPYADEKMKIKGIVSQLLADVKKKYQMKNQELQQELVTLQNSFEAYKEQINWQEEHIKSLEEEISKKDKRIKSLEETCNSNKTEKDEANEWDRGQEFQIQVQEERIQVLEDELKRIKDENMERINSLENELKKTKDESAERIKSLENELKLSKDGNVNETEKELMKSHDDRVQSLEKELTDLNYRLKKQERQIQFLENDLKYKYRAEAAYSENVQKQEIKIQFLEMELNYRENKEDVLKQEKEKLENTVSELTKSADKLMCENLSLNNILKEMKSETKDGCSPNEDFCCETVKQVKLSFIDLIETEFECVICNGMFIEATITTCNHMFCNYCLQMWRKKSPNCPICRSHIKFEIKTTIIDNYIMNTAKLISEKMLNDRKKLIEERKQAVYIAKYKRIRVV